MCEFHHFGICGFGGRCFDIRDYFLLSLPCGQVRGCCTFRLGRLRPGRLTLGGHFRLLGRFRDRLV